MVVYLFTNESLRCRNGMKIRWVAEFWRDYAQCTQTWHVSEMDSE